MIRLLSKKFKIPIVYLVQDRKDLKDLPIGIPYIMGDAKLASYYIRILEFEILYQSALRTGIPFNFLKLLKDNGYNITRYDYSKAVLELISNTELSEGKEEEKSVETVCLTIHDYIKDSAVYVDTEVLKNLKVFPVWLEDIKESINININNFLAIDPLAYNKKLDGMYGSVSLASPAKNLIIIDISGSIPRGCSSTCLALAKTMCESFYADLMITGTITTLYPYDEVQNLNLDTVYSDNGQSNEQRYYKKLVTSDERHYGTVICFGDNHHPGQSWDRSDSRYTVEDGQKLCKWTVDKLISLHTKDYDKLAGYCTWFKPKTIEKIKNWTKYLD